MTTPLSRQEADAAYRRIRSYLILSACWFLILAAVVAIAGISGWKVYLVVVLLIEGVATPLCLRYFRRDLDRRVRAGEEAPARVGTVAGAQ
jgi:hypothetical protein